MLKQIKKILLTTILCVYCTTFINVAQAQSEKADLKEYAEYVADYYNLDDTFIRTIKCESNFDPDAAHPVSSAYGIAQFLDGSWIWFADMYQKDKGVELSRIIPKDSIRLMGWAFNHGYQNHWSCYKKIKSTR